MKKEQRVDPSKYYDPNRKRGVPKFRRSFSVVKMNETHHEIARRLVLGQKSKQIAQDLNISTQTVHNVKNSPIVQEQMMMIAGGRDKHTMDVRKEIESLAPKCVKVIKDQLENEGVSDHLKSKNAFALLSIAGYAPVRNVNVNAVAAILSGDDIERINAKALDARQRALNIAEESGVIDL